MRAKNNFTNRNYLFTNNVEKFIFDSTKIKFSIADTKWKRKFIQETYMFDVRSKAVLL